MLEAVDGMMNNKSSMKLYQPIMKEDWSQEPNALHKLTGKQTEKLTRYCYMHVIKLCQILGSFNDLFGHGILQSK